MVKQFYYGRRLSFDGDLCTVRYLGPVQGTKGEWLGVEWDDPSRGKHSGLHDGIRYFECVSREPHAASFIRPSRPYDSACSFVEAVQKKYVSDGPLDGQAPASDLDEVINISGKDVEEVGFDKIKDYLANIQSLPIILLDGSCIGSQHHLPGDENPQDTVARIGEGAGEACPNVADLDLSRNLFESWAEVLSIVEKLPKLSSLRLDGNILSQFEASRTVLNNRGQPPFSTMKSLSLKDCYLAWGNITAITRCLPSLTTLSIGGNALRKLGAADLPANLTKLSLERNSFETIEDLQSLTNLQSLQSLILNANNIHSISNATSKSTTTEANQPIFPQTLRHIDLSENAISTWAFITALPAIFPGMQSLRTASNPLYHGSAAGPHKQAALDEGFMLTVARIARLEALNYSQITPKERLDADTFYLSRIAKELSATPETDAPRILSQHPRYAELCTTYGEPAVFRKGSTADRSNMLAARLLRLTVELDGETGTLCTQTDRVWTAEIPASFTVYNVLGMVGRHFGLNAMQLRLVWETGEEAATQHGVVEAGGGVVGQGVARRSENREERLEPKIRSIGTWIERGEARIRVELDGEETRRHAAVRNVLAELTGAA